MSKARELVKYLVEVLKLNPNKLEYNEVDITLHVHAKDLGLDGVLIGYKEYTAEIDYEGLPEWLEAYLLPAVGIWINENDPKREGHLGMPTMNSIIYPKSCDVELNVNFREELQLVPKDDGPLSFYGKRYIVGNAPVWTATSFELDVHTKSQEQDPEA